MTVAVIIASLGRPQTLLELVEDLGRQTRPADRIILSVTDSADLPEGIENLAGVEVVFGPKGLCAQRNTALDLLGEGHELIMFLDDDYVPSRFTVERAVRLMTDHPEIAGATGHLLLDGIGGAGISIAEARQALAEYDSGGVPPLIPYRDLAGLYGCNMIFRTRCIAGLRFDERLVLYGWQEDFDFASRAAERGRIVKTFSFAGVHRGIKSGRVSGFRFGYSQVANPLYLARKGTMTPRDAARLAMRNFFANHARAFRPEPWVDRAGRLRGNWFALLDLMTGRISPERILRLSPPPGRSQQKRRANRRES
ncbi:MAG: glycosyl transferase [Sphingomonadales bacterium 32-68-7]|nr:MAG: glycosyl transferase [Sphingomonadales bacterium 12-68-11]OYX09196.1 MAG: glycosyl transferase [Sphingomonadales bacterium 32-68-7]